MFGKRLRIITNVAAYSGSGGPIATTLDPANTSPDLTLSGGNLTFTSAPTYGSSRSTAGHSSGKYYYEITGPWSSFNGEIGVCQSGTTLTGGSGGIFAATAAGGVPGTNNYYVATVNSTFSAQMTSSGNATACAIDLDNKKMWLQGNFTTGWNEDILANQNPATNTGGIDISAIVSGTMYACVGAQNAAFTVNFGGTAYSLTPPAGFGNW